MADMKFISTSSVESFKKNQDIDRIDLVRNPKTEKLFFTVDGEIAGAASEGVLGADRVAISEVQAGDRKFLLMHKQSSDNVLKSF